MRRPQALLLSAFFLLIAPGTVAGLIPYLITRWEAAAEVFPLQILGIVLILPAAAALIDSFLRFALEGEGTPAPIAPPTRLVVNGLYRHVRNPMYVAVVALVLGQALLFASARLLAYAALVWFVFHVFVVMYEEPRLRRQFGAEYDEYRKNVPRWIPRRKPWRRS